jgi:hypothetical protein
MKTWMMRTGAAVLVVAIALGAVGLAAAQGPDTARPRIPAARGRVMVAVLDAVENMSDLSRIDVIAGMRDGKTLSELLQEQGVDPQAVSDAANATLTAEIEQALADGTITQDAADTALANLPDALDRVFNTAMSALTPFRSEIRDRVQNRVEDSLLAVLAEMAGVDPADVLKDALTPPSLRDVAESYGLDADAIIAEAETRITADVNQAVTDGTITQETADTMLAGLHDRLVTRFDAPLRLLPRISDRLGDRMDRMGERFGNGFGGRMGDRFGNRMGGGI